VNDQPEAENGGVEPRPGAEQPAAEVPPAPAPTEFPPPQPSLDYPPADYPPVEPPSMEYPPADYPPMGSPAPPSYPSYINPDAGMLPPDEDPDDIPLPKGRAPASTRYLGVAVLLALAFGGGVVAQKHHDKGYTPPVSGAQAALAAGLGAGGGAAGGAPGAGAGGGVPGSVTFTPKVVGTITDVSGTDITVMGPDGVKHLVHTNASTVVLRKGAVADLKPGTVTAIDGDPDDAGVLTAKGVIAQ